LAGDFTLAKDQMGEAWREKQGFTAYIAVLISAWSRQVLVRARQQASRAEGYFSLFSLS